LLDTNILVSPYRSGWEPRGNLYQIKKLAEDVGQLPRLKRSPDPGDNYLLALAEASKAD
jgi:predicted nucleic acid-binding protein